MVSRGLCIFSFSISSVSLAPAFTKCPPLRLSICSNFRLRLGQLAMQGQLFILNVFAPQLGLKLRVSHVLA